MSFDWDKLDELDKNPWRAPINQPTNQPASASQQGPRYVQERAAAIKQAEARRRAVGQPEPPAQEDQEPPEGNAPQSREWQERKGYRKRAPDEKIAMETKRIQMIEEQNQRRLQEAKRAAALDILQASRGGVLGSGSSGPTGMKDARLALVEKLEQESDPKVKRRERKEQEKQKRDEERRAKEEEDRKRIEEWNIRERGRAERNRDLNVIKAQRWQEWDASACASASTSASASASASTSASTSASASVSACASGSGPSPASPPVSSSECDDYPDLQERLTGRWLYGSKPNEYRIELGSDGHLRFDDGGKTHGILKYEDGFLVAQLQSITGERFGEMRFAYSAVDDTIISNFKKPGKLDWGKDIIAHRGKPPQVWEVIGGANNGGIIVRRGMDLNSEQETERLSTGALIKEEEMTGERLRFTRLTGNGPRTGWVSLNASGVFKALLVKTEMTIEEAMSKPTESQHESQTLQSESCRPPMETGYFDQLIDPGMWQCPVCTLVNQAAASVCSACEQQRPAGSPPTLVLDPASLPPAEAGEPGQGTSHEDVAIAPTLLPAPCEPAAPGGKVAQADLLGWLRSHNLEDYHDAMLDNGFEELDDLYGAEPAELDAMFDVLGVKPGHMLRFRRALRGRASAPRECPVCLCGPTESVNVALTPCGHVFCGQHAAEAVSSGSCFVCRARPRTTQRIFG